MASRYNMCQCKLKPYTLVGLICQATECTQSNRSDSLFLLNGWRLGPCSSGHGGHCSVLANMNWRSLQEDQKWHSALPFCLKICPLETGLSLKNFLWWLFFLSIHVPLLLGQRWVFHPTFLCSLCGHAGKTAGYLMVCTPFSSRGVHAPNGRDSGLHWQGHGTFSL